MSYSSFVQQYQPILISLLPLIPILILSYTARWFYTSLKSVRAERRRRVSGESGSRPGGLEKVGWSVESESSEDEESIAKRRSKARSKSIYEDEEYLRSFPDLTFPETTTEEREQIRRDKVLYHALQNLEDHPDVIPGARSRLSQLLDQTTHAALSNPSDSILSLGSTYNPHSLRTYFSTAHKTNTTKYEAYLSRRRNGGPRELFPNRDFAVEWLRLAGCVKYVDGVWVANILGVSTTQFGGEEAITVSGKEGSDGSLERESAKLAFQVISEEFGDGDLSKNHVHVYNQLLSSLSPTKTSLPGDQPNFDSPDPTSGSARCWTAAIAQQLIGLFSSTNDYYPEALGFNMAYETLPYHLLVTSHELRELKVDDYYFALHVTIDNPDSGHAALARVAVERFLEGVRIREGEKGVERVWKRVQAGVVLADGLPTTPCAPREFTKDISTGSYRLKPDASTSPPATPSEKALVDLLAKKSVAAEKMHCPSRHLIAGYTIEYWLDPSTFTTEKGLRFIRAMAEKRMWVKKGDAAGSKIVQMVLWGGRMFGAFSKSEVGVLVDWVNSLDGVDKGQEVKGSYERFVGGVLEAESRRRESGLGAMIPTFTTSQFEALLSRFPPSIHSVDQILTTSLFTRSSIKPNIPLAQIYYASLSLLETFPLSPSRFATPLGSTVLRILRAQHGFPALHLNEDICAGMDDVHDPLESSEGTIDLWGLGKTLGYGTWGYERLSNWAAEEGDGEAKVVVRDMLELRVRPYAQQGLLLGLCWAFTKTVLRDGLSVQGVEDEDLVRIREEMATAIKEHLDAVQAQHEGDWLADFKKGHDRFIREVCV